ncbi:MAG: molybdopterin-binding protein [Desulfohalobiaceae bacterium]
MGKVDICPACGEPYPVHDGPICRGCQGEAPYEFSPGQEDSRPNVRSVPVQEAVGQRTAHDMTRIVPGENKDAEFNAGQTLAAGDVCRLQQMGRNTVYVQDQADELGDWVHEDQAALEFARAMAGPGVEYDSRPKEGKINFRAARQGLFVLDQELLRAFNLQPRVVCASRQNRLVVEEGKILAGTRAIPLYLEKAEHARALRILGSGTLLQVLQLRRPKTGILVTGTEVFTGLIQDRFIPVIKAKVENFSGEVVGTDIVPDQAEAIQEGLGKLLRAGADLVITTAGLSVDPEDVTRQGLLRAGLEQECFGLPVLPGAMTLCGRIGSAQVLGVPACALYYKTTSLDLILPQLLAGLQPTSQELAAMGEGGLCLGCRSCTYPKCPFGK